MYCVRYEKEWKKWDLLNYAKPYKCKREKILLLIECYKQRETAQEERGNVYHQKHGDVSIAIK